MIADNQQKEKVKQGGGNQADVKNDKPKVKPMKKKEEKKKEEMTLNYLRIPQKYSGDDKRDTQGYLKIDKKQKLRKKENDVSRELDNYYNPDIHKRFWMPNGTFRRNKLYEYDATGLGYYYEKKNVEQKKITYEEKEENKKKSGLQYVEYDYLQQNEFNVTIEYCANCEEHSSHTRHSPELFKNYAMRTQQCINLRFPFIAVTLKPIDTDILQEEEYNKKFPKKCENGQAYEGMPNINDKFKDVRIGAFEIQIAKKNAKGETETALIHSKLKSGKWPKIGKVLEKIVGFLPCFKGEIHLFEKEETESGDVTEESNQNNEEQKDEKQKEIDESLYNSKLLGIQVNIYLLKNEKIKQIIAMAEKDIEIELDPKKRMEKLNEERKNAKESPYSNGGNANSQIKTEPVVSEKATNPATSQRMSARGQSASLSATRNMNRGPALINSKKESEGMKGTLIITKYTDKNGVIKFGPIPYDSYFIEVVESNEFQFVGVPLTFNRVMAENEIYKKFIGLMIQDDAFLQIHVYENKVENNAEDQVHVKDSYVTVQTYYDGTTSNEVLERKEMKLNLQEGRTGIFEHMVEVGKYLIEVSKQGYETVRKVCDFDKGLNCVNIQMVPCRNYCFKLRAMNLTKFVTDKKTEYLKNCEVYVYKSSSDILLEGITDKKGEFTFSTGENVENLTIVVQKMGFRPIQRVFIKTKEVNINNETNEYEQSLYFYLVKEDFFEKYGGYSIILTYCNLLDSNFELEKAEKNKDENQNENKDDEEEEEKYDEIMPLCLKVKTAPLLVTNDQELSREMNGIEKFSCQTVIYTKNNSFYLSAPQFCEKEFNYWNLGWLDPKNCLFYEVNTLNNESVLSNNYFDNWLDFVQKILDEKIYEKLFEYFGFDKNGILTEDDRTLIPEVFEKKLIEMNICGEEGNGDIERFITDSMKGIGGNISFTLFKQKILANIKNFREEIEFSSSNPMAGQDIGFNNDANYEGYQ